MTSRTTIADDIQKPLDSDSKMSNLTTIRKCPDLLSKFRGAMLGSLIGDCLGFPFEGEDKPIAKSILNPYFEKLQETPPGGKILYKPYTDDTAMTFSLARSLIEKKQFDPCDVAKKFVTEYYAQPKRGYGANIIEVFKALKVDDCKDPFGPARLQFAGRGSFGNGSAMRITPVALFCHQNVEEAINMAYKSSLITHTNELGYNGAILQCLAVCKALQLDPTQELDTDKFARELEEKMGQIEKCDSNVAAYIGGSAGYGGEPQTVTSLLQTNEDPLKRQTVVNNLLKSSYRTKLEEMRHLLKKQPKPSPEKVIDVLGHYVTAYGSVPTAIYSFLRSVNEIQENSGNGLLGETSFQRAVRIAISLGGDTDTIASMTGAIAGAYYGQENISQTLLDHCEGVQEALNLADGLYEVIEQ